MAHCTCGYCFSPPSFMPRDSASNICADAVAVLCRCFLEIVALTMETEASVPDLLYECRMGGSCIRNGSYDRIGMVLALWATVIVTLVGVSLPDQAAFAIWLRVFA